MLGLEILLTLATLGWLIWGAVSVSFDVWFVVLIVLAVVGYAFEYRRKRLARKIDVAEGMIAAKEK